MSPAEEIQLEDRKLAFVSDSVLPTELLTAVNNCELQNCYGWWWIIRWTNFGLRVSFNATVLRADWKKVRGNQFEENTSGAGNGAQSSIILKVISERTGQLICSDLWLLKGEAVTTLSSRIQVILEYDSSVFFGCQ